MSSEQVTRRAFSAGLIASVPGLAMARSAYARTAAPLDDVSHDNEAIHQDVSFKAAPKLVYAALIDPKQFGKIVMLGGAMGAVTAGTVAASIAPGAGGSFSLFGGHITGRHVEMVPGVRLVQAWRSADWKAGVYSIVRFELAAQGSGTRLSFDHTGFPAGQGQHLSEGWTANYWTPMRKFLDK